MRLPRDAGGTDHPVASQPGGTLSDAACLSVPVGHQSASVPTIAPDGTSAWLAGRGGGAWYRAVRPVLGCQTLHAYLIVVYDLRRPFAHSIGNSVLAMAASGCCQLPSSRIRPDLERAPPSRSSSRGAAASIPSTAPPLAVWAPLTGLSPVSGFRFANWTSALVLLALTVATGVWLRLVVASAGERSPSPCNLQVLLISGRAWSTCVSLARLLTSTLSLCRACSLRHLDRINQRCRFCVASALLFTVASVGLEAARIWSLSWPVKLSRPERCTVTARDHHYRMFCAVAMSSPVGIW